MTSLPNPSFDFTDPDRFTAGTVGQPGERVFFIQVAAGTSVATFKVEKQQVIALAEHLEALLADLPDWVPLETEQSLLTPIEADWTVGDIALGWDDARERILVVLAEARFDLGADEADEAEASGAEARISLGIGMAAAFAEHASRLAAAGRQPCPLCGKPMDPEGHACVRSNGHRPH